MSADLEAIARVAHEANRAYCEATDDVVPERWHRTSSADRDSKRHGVQVALGGATPREQHEAWCETKFAEGWIWGEVKDTNRLTHPCLTGYDKLPEAQRRKDSLFSAVVKALAS